MGSGFPTEKGRDSGINGKKWAGKWDLRSLLGTLKIASLNKPTKSKTLGWLQPCCVRFRKSGVKNSILAFVNNRSFVKYVIVFLNKEFPLPLYFSVWGFVFFTKNFPGKFSRSLIRFKKPLRYQKVSEFIVKGLFTPTKKFSRHWYKLLLQSKFHLWRAACF